MGSEMNCSRVFVLLSVAAVSAGQVIVYSAVIVTLDKAAGPGEGGDKRSAHGV